MLLTTDQIDGHIKSCVKYESPRNIQTFVKAFNKSNTSIHRLIGGDHIEIKFGELMTDDITQKLKNMIVSNAIGEFGDDKGLKEYFDVFNDQRPEKINRLSDQLNLLNLKRLLYSIKPTYAQDNINIGCRLSDFLRLGQYAVDRNSCFRENNCYWSAKWRLATTPGSFVAYWSTHNTIKSRCFGVLFNNRNNCFITNVYPPHYYRVMQNIIIRYMISKGCNFSLIQKRRMAMGTRIYINDDGIILAKRNLNKRINRNHIPKYQLKLS
ncbi:MAG: hypothetical protein BAJALOKI3v1_50035 [Promethearchaeota archaeon]|nr:MAG: hypothetical protein BAJALOKI3v1_50035 [Candidatus Lokiarchaeota archaeon]